MKKYVKPSYDAQQVDVNDVVLASMVMTDVGIATLGSITGEKVEVATSFESLLFGTR